MKNCNQNMENMNKSKLSLETEYVKPDKPKTTINEREESSSLKSDIKSTFKKFSQANSLKAVTKSCKSDDWVLRIYWFVVFLGGSAIGCYLLYILIDGYISFEITTKISSCTNCKPTFPDITVCNINPLSMIKDTGIGDYAAYEEEMIQRFEPEISNISLATG